MWRRRTSRVARRHLKSAVRMQASGCDFLRRLQSLALPPKKRRNGPKDAANQPRWCVQPTPFGGSGDCVCRELYACILSNQPDSRQTMQSTSTSRSGVTTRPPSTTDPSWYTSTPGSVRPSHPALGATCSRICPSLRERVSQSFHDCLSCPACLDSVRVSERSPEESSTSPNRCRPESRANRRTSPLEPTTLEKLCECRERMFLSVTAGMCDRGSLSSGDRFRQPSVQIRFETVPIG